MTRGGFRFGLSAFNIIALLFVLSPIIVVVISSFGATMYMRFPPQGFTFKWYAQALSDRNYWNSFQTSVFIAVIAAMAATFTGALAAWALVRYSVRGRMLLENAFLLPLTLPHLILGIAILTLTQPMGLGSSIARLVVAHVVITIPYVLRVLMPVISELRVELEEAAADLGATRRAVLWTITLPLLLPSVLVSAALAFMVSFDELVLSLFLAPPAQRTLPMQIFSNVEFGLDPSVGAVSTLLLTATFVVMLLGQASSRFKVSNAAGGV
jgi:putative spermidine/putrescine transport system permease protein